MAGAVVLAAIVVLVIALSGKGGGGLSPGSSLAWDAKPEVIRPADLPNDRVAFGEVRNNSLRPIRVSAADLEVLDADKQPVRYSARFIASFAHGLYGAFQQPDVMPELEQLRLGYLAKLNPGQRSPLLVSAHLGRGTELPLRVYYKGSPVLDIPREARTAG